MSHIWTNSIIWMKIHSMKHNKIGNTEEYSNTNLLFPIYPMSNLTKYKNEYFNEYFHIDNAIIVNLI